MPNFFCTLSFSKPSWNTDVTNCFQPSEVAVSDAERAEMTTCLGVADYQVVAVRAEKPDYEVGTSAKLSLPAAKPTGTEIHHVSSFIWGVRLRTSYLPRMVNAINVQGSLIISSALSPTRRW